MWGADHTDLLSQYVLCSSIAVWFGSATKSDVRRLHRTVRTAERIIRASLPNLHISRKRKRAGKITHTLSTLPLWTAALWPAQNSQTQDQFYLTWTTHNTPLDCTSVNYSVKLSSVNTTYTILSTDIYFLYIVIYCLFSLLLVFLLP